LLVHDLPEGRAVVTDKRRIELAKADQIRDQEKIRRPPRLLANVETQLHELAQSLLLGREALGVRRHELIQTGRRMHLKSRERGFVEGIDPHKPASLTHPEAAQQTVDQPAPFEDRW